MTFLPVLRRWFAPVFFPAAGFVAGYVAFHPGWTHAPRLTDGSAGAFERAAKQISAGDLLAQASPKERVGWLLETCRQKASLQRDRALYEAIQHLQPGDFLAAIADLQAFGNEMAAVDQNLLASLIEASVERWLDVDESGALRWLSATRVIVDSDAIKLPKIGHADMGALFGVLARRNPEWAFEQALKLGKNTQRDTGITTVFMGCARGDPQKARAWLKTLEGTADWAAAYKGCVQGIAESDPPAALEMVLGVDEKNRGDLILSTIWAAGMRTPSRLSEMLAKLDPTERAAYPWMALSTLENQPNFDPFAWMQEQIAATPEMLEPRYLTATGGIGTLVSRDGARTMEMLAGLPDSARETLMTNALRQWSYMDPTATIDWLAKQSVDALPKNLTALAECARQAPERYAQWMATLPEGEMRNRVLLIYAGQMSAASRVAEAIGAFSGARPDENGALDFASKIAVQDLAATRQWIGTLPEGDTQAGAVQGLVKTWVAQSPQAVAQWLETQPAGSVRDQGARAFAGATAGVDPEAAALWLEQIRDPGVREAAVTDVFPKYATMDMRAARAWLRQLPGVSDVVKARLLAKRL